jgi:diguanylate cyclase
MTSLESEMADLRASLNEQQAISLRDALTGVFNRLGYTEAITREHSRWQRHGGELSLAILDLDLFKSINDQFGHATGDKVLTAVAALFRKQVRAGDLVCRIGGEEFVVVMPETSLDAAVVVADKLREAVAASQFRLKDQPVPVTISCGVAAFHDVDGIDEVFERADQALYRAKAKGRNRYCVEELGATNSVATLVES